MASTSPSRSARFGRRHLERYAVFLFGVVFLVAILVIVIWRREPSAAEFFVFRLTLALASAGVGALMPGFIEIDQPLPHKGLLRTGGALALFVLVWSTNPGKFAIDRIPPPPQGEARKVIDKAVALVDARQYPEAYALYSSAKRAAVHESTFIEMFANTRDPLGKRVKGPVLYGSSAAPTMMGTNGPFVALVYQSRFENKAEVWSEYVQVIAEDGQWKMDAHMMAPCVPPACVVSAGL